MTDAELAKLQAQADQDDVLNAVAAWMLEARRAGMKRELLPKYLYLNSRVWEDEVGPHLRQPDGSNLLTELGIEVRHSPLMPRDRFSFTRDPYPADEVGKYLRQHEALPARA